MRRIQFDCVLKAHNVLEEPDLVIDYVTRVGLSHQQKGEQVRTDRSQGSYCNVSLRSPARDVLGSAEALSWGPLAGVGSHLLSSPVLGQWESPELGQPRDEKFDLGFFHSCFICPTYPTPSVKAGSLLFLQEESRLLMLSV